MRARVRTPPPLRQQVREMSERIDLLVEYRSALEKELEKEL